MRLIGWIRRRWNSFHLSEGARASIWLCAFLAAYNEEVGPFLAALSDVERVGYFAVSVIVITLADQVL